MAELIIIIGFVQALFGILIFISKRPRHLCFSLLTIWLSIIAVFLGAQLLPFEVVNYFKPGVFPILFLFGPLLYFYVGSLSIEDFKLKLNHIWHLIPLALISIHRSTIDAVSVSSSSNLAENPAFIFNKIYFVLLIISMLVYWIFSVKLISIHKKNIPFYFSNYSSKNTLNWLIFVVLIFLLFFVAELFVSSFEKMFDINLIKFPILFTNLTIFTFIMVFFGINQSAIYKFNKKDVDSSEDESIEKYKHSALNESQIEDITKKVFEYVKMKKPYLNLDFSFQMMVDDLGISRQNLSQVINTGQKKNFYKLINEFRVEEVKEMLASNKHSNLTVLGIAFECGFSSKTTFNRIFKEETGMTPTAYIKAL
jgi:AraC-like DNA-binding protein